MGLKLVLIILGVLGLELGWAAPSKKAMQEDVRRYLSEGAFVGGQAGKGYSILNMQRVASKSKKSERMVIEMGDFLGKSLSGGTGYYHAQLHKNPPRLSIDFAQTEQSKIDQKKLATIVKDSALVKKANMTVDPEDRSLNVTFYFNKPVKARVYSLAPQNRNPKVVLDFVSTK